MQVTVQIARGLAPIAVANEALGLVTWTWSPATHAVEWSADLSPLMGLPPGTYGHTHADFLAQMHPDDREASRLRLRACLKGELPRYRAEERVIWPDGSVHWLETYGRGEYGPDGRAVLLAGVVRDITERHRAAAARDASEARFRQLIERAPVAIGISRGDVVSYANEAFARLFGYVRPEDAVGRPVLAHVQPDQHANFVHRTRARQTGAPAPDSYELPVLRADGTKFTCLVSVADVELEHGAETLVFLQDVSESTRDRLALQRERDRARQFLQVAEALLVALDRAGRVTLLNRKGHQVLGHAEGDLLGLNWFETCVAPDDAPALRRAFGGWLQGQRLPVEPFEFDALTRTGGRRRIAWRVSLVHDAAGEVSGVLCSGEDVTERREAEAALRQLNASLEQRVAERTRDLELSNAALAEARDSAQAATRAKSQFLANMSHEIRTPMNAIMGMTDLALRHGHVPARVRAYLGHIQGASRALLEIVDELLDFSKIEAGQLTVEATEFDLGELLERLTVLVGHRAAEKGLDFLVDTAVDVPRRLRGDALRIGQVLLNLCGNAVKFTERGEIVVVTVKLQAVAVPVGAGPSVQVRFAVRDTGIGIAPDSLPRLFQPFDQLDPSTTRRYGGTGLGLAISKQLVELMGGEIGVRSEPGRGSEFFFVLPLQVVEPEAERAAPAAHGAQLLVVDDSAASREIFARQLGALGYPHTVCASVEEALAVMRGTKQPFAAVLVDWKMPGADGFEAARRMRELCHPGRPPRLVLVTAYGDDAVAQRARREGFDAYLAKPVFSPALAATLESLLGSAVPGPPAAAGGEPLPQLAGRRLLLVEDNELNQIVAVDLLQGVAGAEVVVASGGVEALELLQHGAFDAVLMDIQMPDMDGYEVTRRLRADPRHAAVPVIAMTAHALARDREQCLAVGMREFISKPFEPAELFAALGRALEPRPEPAWPAEATMAASTPAADGLDPVRGIARCLGRSDLYRRVLERFVAQRGDEADALHAAVEAGDVRKASRIAHSHISTAGMIGAEALSLTSRELQLALDEGHGEGVATLVARFLQLHVAAREAAVALLDAGLPEATGVGLG